ncbi:putative guanine nucleotide-binding protein alpha-2 subunit [Triangularia verruculosa]|uniref:Guanine nucleotide-binding protein alpha-2 subunit n=1 Tax=Triangularia verruculosa TaxID=2587418 RepID=A0AAN7AS62_9PEZI|nr:putative guanine nucleotide-binding protein alpha-2 subunit [Triangularia verruculosa]
MADPLSIVGAVGSVAGIIDALTRSISAIAKLRNQYKDADLLVITLTSQLSVLRTALVKIAAWAESEPEPHYQLKMDLDSVILCCQILASKLDSHLENFHQSGVGKLKLALNGDNIDAIQKMIGQQTATLTLLLAACNTKSLSEQRRLLEEPTTRTAIAAMEKDSASLIVHGDRASICTADTDTLSRLSAIFPFDNQLLTTKVYGRAWRTALLDRVQRRHRRAVSDVTTTVPSEEPGLLTAPILVAQNRSPEIPLPTSSSSKPKVKVLLLGTGGSGKTTLLKQMKVIWGGESHAVTFEEKLQSRQDINQMLCRFFLVLLFDHKEDVDYSELGTRDRMEEIRTILINAIAAYDGKHFITDEGDSIFYDQVVPVVRDIWAIESWQARALRSHEWLNDVLPVDMFASHLSPRRVRELLKDELPSDIAYFMSQFDRVSDRDYMPDVQDILHAPRGRTCGVRDYVFDVGDMQCSVYDVGGRRPERKKWVHAFENVDIILFEVPVGAYDVPLREENRMINMMESLTLFQSVVNSRWFPTTAFLINFTKMDIFQQRINNGQYSLSEHHPDYEGDPSDERAVLQFVQDQFLNRIKERRGPVHFYSLDATCTPSATLMLERVEQLAKRRKYSAFT